MLACVTVRRLSAKGLGWTKETSAMFQAYRDSIPHLYDGVRGFKGAILLIDRHGTANLNLRMVAAHLL